MIVYMGWIKKRIYTGEYKGKYKVIYIKREYMGIISYGGEYKGITYERRV